MSRASSHSGLDPSTSLKRKQSRLGLASVSIAIVTCGYLAISHGLSLLAMLMNHPHRALHLVEEISTPEWFFLIVGLALIGVGIGIAGIVKPRRHRLVPCVGTLINLAVICDVIYLWVS